MALSTNPDDIVRELRQLRGEFDGVKGIVNGWASGTGIDPYFSYLRARESFFDTPPLQVAQLRVLSSGQVIPDANWTVISWDNIGFNNGLLVNQSTASGQSSLLRISSQATFTLFSGFIDFDANTSGIRAVAQNASTASTASQDVMSQLSAITGGDTFIPFSATWVSDNTSARRISVWQNSGGNLSLDGANITLFRVL